MAAVFTTIRSPQPVAAGPVSGHAVLVGDVIESRYGWWVLAETTQGVFLFDLGEAVSASRGDTVRFQGMARGEPGRRGSQTYRAVVDVRSIEVVVPSSSLPTHLGDALRTRVMDRLEPLDDGRSLLAGFLIGDTTGVARSDIEAMRRSGLAHFVAVSGSNVALFLALLAFAAGPLALGPKRRAVVGLLGLPVYAAATRFEPSVMRASVMAGLALGGRLLGFVFEAWQLLSLAVIVLLALDPGLTASAGFQLSVAATAGVLVGARWPVRGGKLGRVLAVTAGAQAGVAPLLLIHFGSVPLMSPVVNVMAAPVVAASTLIGAIGVAGPGPLVDIAAFLAEVVLVLARGAAAWPQLGPWSFFAIFAVAVTVLRWPRTRAPIAFSGSVLVVALVVATGVELPDPGVVVLDVGQGDAILIHGGDGRFALVDGGPDDLVLLDRLRRYGVTSLDLIVLTHVHADHAAGLAGMVGTMRIGQVWARTEPHSSEASERLINDLAAHDIPIEAVGVGAVWRLGELRLVVEGPLRRYASPNDQSIVLSVHGPRRTMLLAGDIETFAQAELTHLRADVLKVPHQGAATSDPEWLASIGAELAVISVGPNQFGHPVAWVIELLEESGADVVRTDEAGDIVVPLS